jgi:hypothetical protein
MEMVVVHKKVCPRFYCITMERAKDIARGAIKSVHHLWKIKPASTRKCEISLLPAHI